MCRIRNISDPRASPCQLHPHVRNELHHAFISPIRRPDPDEHDLLGVWVSSDVPLRVGSRYVVPESDGEYMVEII